MRREIGDDVGGEELDGDERRREGGAADVD